MFRSRMVILVLVGVALFFSFLNGEGLKRTQQAVVTMFAPLVRGSAVIKKNITTWAEPRRSVCELEKENEFLVLENKRLQAESEVLHAAQEENNTLRKALSYRERSSFKLLPATVIARDNGAWWNSVKIDHGSNDGITSDMPVITESGLVGKTTVVTPTVSIVLLITDENCNVASKVQGTSEQGICTGLRVPSEEVQLDFLSKLANLEPGQKVYTAGVSGGIFPSGIEIGTVKSFHVRELDGQAILEPTVDLSNLDHVFVIVGAK